MINTNIHTGLKIKFSSSTSHYDIDPIDAFYKQNLFKKLEICFGLAKDTLEGYKNL
jgi:hypothetical protein